MCSFILARDVCRLKFLENTAAREPKVFVRPLPAHALQHSSTADRYVGLLQVPRHFENPLGITHGGSVAMSIQQTASQMHTKRRKADEGDSYLRRVEIRYLSGLKKGDVLIAVDSEQGGSRMSGTVASAAAPAVPSSQFDLEWARF